MELNRHMKNNQKDANNTLHWNGAIIRETNIQEKEKSKQEEANKRPIKAKKERSLVRTGRSISFPPPPRSLLAALFGKTFSEYITTCRSLKMEKESKGLPLARFFFVDWVLCSKQKLRQ